MGPTEFFSEVDTIAMLKQKFGGLDISPVEAALFMHSETVKRCSDYQGLVDAITIVNDLHNLGDSIYSVREREGEGWDGPNVEKYSAALGVIEKHLWRCSKNEKPEGKPE